MASDGTDNAAAPKAKETSLWKGFVAGGFGGMCLVAAGHPLDLIKVRLQTMTRYNSAFDCFKTTLREEGPLGLYKGMSAPLAGVTPIFALNFWAYDLACQTIRKTRSYAPGANLSLVEYGVGGAFAAIPTTVIMAPGERIKCILQIQASGGSTAGAPKYAGPMDVIKGLYKEGGIRNLYKGSAATLARDGTGSFFYFSFYEGVSQMLSASGQGANPLAVIAGGGMAGVANWTVAIPFDTVKSRIQTFPAGSFKGMADCARQLAAEEGVLALWKGVGPAMLRAFPANAACFLGRDFCLKFLDWVAPNW